MQRRLLLAFVVTTACCNDSGMSPSDEPDVDASDSGGDASRVEELVRSDARSALVVEIDEVVGFEADPRATVEIVGVLESLLDKPGGVVAELDGSIESRGADYAWTDSELFALAAEHNKRALAEDEAVIHVMFVDGHSARDGDGGVVLGLAWANRHLVMFKNTLRDVCAAPTVPAPIRDELCLGAEIAIWTHELGHVIGLVDAGLEMVVDHKDGEHGAHDSNSECVMYWAYDGQAAVDYLQTQLLAGSNAELGFDDECLSDVAALRDRD